MVGSAKSIKLKLIDILQNVTQTTLFVRRAGKDFTRNNKLPFMKTMIIILSMGSLNLNREMLRFFSFSTETPTASAFVQQRDKILPEAFGYIFRQFTDSLPEVKSYYGYRLLAVDGTDINIPCDPKDGSTYFQTFENAQGYNLLHLTALYDLRNRLYVDYIVQPRLEKNEIQALSQMVNRSSLDGPSIILGDRGFESYNAFVHLEKIGIKYATRVKDVESTGILSGLSLPDGEFDIDVKKILTRKQTKEVKKSPEIYKVLWSHTVFDHFDDDGFCPVFFRVVRFKLRTGGYESIITNLDRVKFPPDSIKELYNMRWGIETSFRELKYTIGLSMLHAKKMDSILQEISARLIMYNFCEVIVNSIIISQKNRKYSYKVNFTIAVDICIQFFRYRGNDPPDVGTSIQKYISPVRDGRAFTRVILPKGFVSFVYRVA